MQKHIILNAEKNDKNFVNTARDIILAGGVVAYPTETIYGLAVDATNETAIKKIFAIKGRGFDSPISIIIHSPEQLTDIVTAIHPDAKRLIDSFWPGALTIIFSAHSTVSKLLTAGTGKIGVRISSHYVAHQLALMLGKPITATSANLSGMTECHTAKEAFQQLGSCVDLIIDGGKSPLGVASTIIDVTTKPFTVLREGTIKVEEIFNKLQIKFA
ncbi:MAG: L-threonylcarbamoyladenylate synthase [Deltaproteobacteria bacterium]